MHEQLRDGSRIEIRPIEPEDRDDLAAGFARLSPESRYRRFFAPVTELSPRELDYLTRVDHHDHEALLAIDAATGTGVGVARFVRTAPTEAEPAIVVADDWHGRGVASVLLGRLVDRAREEGITRFNAPVLATNTDAIRVLERLGATTRRSAGREVELIIDLPPAPAPASRALGMRALLRAAAEGTLAPTSFLIRSLSELPLHPAFRRSPPPGGLRGVVVVGVDGSEDAARAAEAAATLAAAAGDTVLVVGVHRLLLPEREVVETAVQETTRALRARGLDAQSHVRRGEPAPVLLDVAVEQAARLIVVGAGARAGAVRRLLGSTADTVAEQAPCDVLIVRERRV